MDQYLWYFEMSGYKVVERGVGDRERVEIDGYGTITKYPVSYYVRSEDILHFGTQELKQVVLALDVETGVGSLWKPTKISHAREPLQVERVRREAGRGRGPADDPGLGPAERHAKVKTVGDRYHLALWNNELHLMKPAIG